LANSEKDLIIARLQEDLRQANAANRPHGNESPTIQILQQKLSERDGQIRNLNLRVNQEKHLRTAADRRADQSARQSQRAGQQCQNVLEHSRTKNQKSLALKQRLVSTESRLKAAQMREQLHFAEDERRLQEMGAAMQHRGGAGNVK
jgi:hypothetical protein